LNLNKKNSKKNYLTLKTVLTMMFNEWKKLGLMEKTTLLAAEEKSITGVATKEIEKPHWVENRSLNGNCRTEICAEWVTCPVETGNKIK
jgi:hypothetical protein